MVWLQEKMDPNRMIRKDRPHPSPHPDSASAISPSIPLIFHSYSALEVGLSELALPSKAGPRQGLRCS